MKGVLLLCGFLAGCKCVSSLASRHCFRFPFPFKLYTPGHVNERYALLQTSLLQTSLLQLWPHVTATPLTLVTRHSYDVDVASGTVSKKLSLAEESLAEESLVSMAIMLV